MFAPWYQHRGYRYKHVAQSCAGRFRIWEPDGTLVCEVLGRLAARAHIDAEISRVARLSQTPV